MAKELSPFVRGEVIEQVEDGRFKVSWRCQCCEAMNEDLGLPPTAGFECKGCNAATRVHIRP